MSRETLQGIEDAIRAHLTDSFEEEDSEERKSAVIIDWIAAYTISNVVDVEGEMVIGYTNEYASADNNPNGQAHLARWASDEIADVLYGGE